jgi:hypothetical protein
VDLQFDRLCKTKIPGGQSELKLISGGKGRGIKHPATKILQNSVPNVM